MQIRVERVIEGRNLVFKIVCSEPKALKFEATKALLKNLDNTIKSMQLMDDSTMTLRDKRLQEATITSTKSIQCSCFEDLKNNMVLSIENEFEPRFKHIIQEIYNWISDHQSSEMIQWMSDFDPQRTKYYFDNDNTPDNQLKLDLDDDDY